MDIGLRRFSSAYVRKKEDVGLVWIVREDKRSRFVVGLMRNFLCVLIDCTRT